MERRGSRRIVLLRVVHEHLGGWPLVSGVVAVAYPGLYSGSVVWRDHHCGGADMAAKEPFATILTVLIAIRKAGGG